MKIKKMSVINCQFILFIIFISINFLNTQRSSNGRHRIWLPEDEEQPPQQAASSFNVGDNLVINQNLSPSTSKKFNNNTIFLNIDNNRSINLTPEPLAAEVLKVDLTKSNMLLVSSSPAYKLLDNNQTGQDKKEKIDRSINFIPTYKRMLNPNQLPKHCLSNLDCDLELNERCLLPDNEEILYYDQLLKIQPLTSIYSQYLRKKWKALKINDNLFSETAENDRNSPICGCSSPSFVRNQVTGQCELLRVVELKFKLRTDLTSIDSDIISRNGDNEKKSANQLFEQEQNSKTDNFIEKKKSYYHQLKLDALGQIDYIIKNSDTLQDIVHHFRLTNLEPLKIRNKNLFNEIDERENRIKKKRNIQNKKFIFRKTRSTTTENRIQSQFIVRGLLLLFASEYTSNFDLLFNNEYCTTQNILRIKTQQKLFNQALAASNQTWKTIHFNTIRSVDFLTSLNNISDNVNKRNVNFNLENQSNQVNLLNINKLNAKQNRFDSNAIELSFIHNKRKKRETKKDVNEGDENYGLDVQLYEVNSDQINICNLNENYATEELNNARYRYDLANNIINGNNLTQIELEKKEKQLDYERRFFRLTYCDDRRAFCESLPTTRAGYVCVCHSNLMDLSPFVELPGEYCGVKCPVNYCGGEGFCHVRNSIGYYPNPDYDLATQQRYLSTAGRMVSFSNGKLLNKKDNLSKLNNLEKLDDSEIVKLDYQTLIDSYKKNQTLLRQRYYAAIYSVQQRFSQLFENMPNLKLTSPNSKSSELKKDKEEDKYKFDYSYSFSQTPQLVTFYCTCPGWTMGSRCQFSGWMILLVLGILVVLLALVTICTVSMLCVPGSRSIRRESTKSSSKSTKSNLNTTSLTISESCSSKDSFDIDLNSQQFNQQQEPHHHNQFNDPINRQRRASEFINDRRSSFTIQTNENENMKWNKPIITQHQITQSKKAITQHQQPIFNIIQASPHVIKEPTQHRIQFTDTITEIPYHDPIDKNRKLNQMIPTISTQVQQRNANSNKIYPSDIHNQIRKLSKPLINQDRLLKEQLNERRFEFYNNENDNYYNTIDDDLNDNTINTSNKLVKLIDRKENQTQTPITHVHNIYATDGELRIESEEPNYVQMERRSVGSQTSGIQSGEVSLKNQKQSEYDEEDVEEIKNINKQNHKTPTITYLV